MRTGSGVFVSAADTGTDPASADTDGDGFDDADEVALGTDPTNPFSFPGSPTVPSLDDSAHVLLVLFMLAAGGLALVDRRGLRGRT